MKKNIIYCLIIVTVVVLIIVFNSYPLKWKHNFERTDFWELYYEQRDYIPEDGFVPNEKTAVKIAELVWLPIYGNGVFLKRPYRVALLDDIWIVEGYSSSFSHFFGSGGNPYIEICKITGKILCVSHSLD